MLPEKIFLSAELVGSLPPKEKSTQFLALAIPEKGGNFPEQVRQMS
jgi:hypothetical protein